MAKCPVHNEVLSTYTTTLTKMEKSFDCTAGTCPKCNVASIVIILLSLILMLAVPTAGIIFALLGVALFLLGKTYTKKAKAMKEIDEP